jgi:hypothetical protein
MQEARKISEDVNRMAQETTEQARKFGEDYRKAATAGFEAANRSFGEAARGFQTAAAEVTNYSRKSTEDVIGAWEQLLKARSIPELLDVQTRYAQKMYEGYVSQASRLIEIYFDLTRNASRQVEQASRR